MSRLEFEYFDHLLAAVYIFFFVIVLTASLTTVAILDGKDPIHLGLSVVVPVIILLVLMKKKCVKNAYAEFSSDNVCFIFDNRAVKVELSNIKKYKISYVNGKALIIYTKSGEKIKIFSNNNFQNIKSLSVLCERFEIFIGAKQYSAKFPELLNETSQSITTIANNIERKKSIVESKWYPYFLITITLALVIIKLFEDKIYKEGSVTASYYTMVFSALALWGGYFMFKEDNKKQTEENPEKKSS